MSLTMAVFGLAVVAPRQIIGNTPPMVMDRMMTEGGAEDHQNTAAGN